MFEDAQRSGRHDRRASFARAANPIHCHTGIRTGGAAWTAVLPKGYPRNDKNVLIVHRRRHVRDALGVVPASPNRRKLRMLRPGAVPDDVMVVIRAAPASVQAAIEDIARDALESGRTYDVQNDTGNREALFGVSVFAHRPGVDLLDLLDLLARFDDAPTYLATQVETLRSAEFTILLTGANVDDFDIQLLPGHTGDDPSQPALAVRAAAARLVAAAGELRPNPAYHGEPDLMGEEE